MPGVILIVSIPDIRLLPYFLYAHEYRLTRNTVYCAILSDQIVVGVPISYYFLKAVVAGPAGPASAGPLFWPSMLSAVSLFFSFRLTLLCAYHVLVQLLITPVTRVIN